MLQVTLINTLLRQTPIGVLSRLLHDNVLSILLTSCSFSPAPEIFRYFEGVAEKFNVLQHVQLNSRIISAAFNEPTSKWRLCVSTADQKQDTEVEADVFINATGILNKWKWPDIAGLQNFAGPKLHTANWVRRQNPDCVHQLTR